MVEAGYGRIVTIASVAGKEGNPNAGAYSASKGGVMTLTKSLSKDHADQNIAVNCVTPRDSQDAHPRSAEARVHRLHAKPDSAGPLS